MGWFSVIEQQHPIRKHPLPASGIIPLMPPHLFDTAITCATPQEEKHARQAAQAASSEWHEK